MYELKQKRGKGKRGKRGSVHVRSVLEGGCLNLKTSGVDRRKAVLRKLVLGIAKPTKHSIVSLPNASSTG